MYGRHIGSHTTLAPMTARPGGEPCATPRKDGCSNWAQGVFSV
jgi:hypothetical protein